MTKVLGLDLSTTCTGWATCEVSAEGVKLKEYGKIQHTLPRKHLAGLTYPVGQLEKMRNLCVQILKVLEYQKVGLEHVVIEEINRGKNRIGQKVLDGFHFVLLDWMDEDLLKKVIFKDSDGPSGWRKDLGLILTPEDKQLNKERKRWNKKLPKRARGKLPIINSKHLACRFVNKQFGTKFDVDKNKKDSDVVDAIAMTYAVCSRMDLTTF